jgi:hypothetical protein
MCAWILRRAVRKFPNHCPRWHEKIKVQRFSCGKRATMRKRNIYPATFSNRLNVHGPFGSAGDHTNFTSAAPANRNDNNRVMLDGCRRQASGTDDEGAVNVRAPGHRPF